MGKAGRQNLNEVCGQINQVKEKVNYVIETGKAHSQGAYNELLEEDNLVGRVGVIAAGGTLGLLVGALRGRFVKRVIYTALGAGAGTAISYPDQAKQLSNDAYVETRKKALIAYTFVSGVESGPPAESSFASSTLTLASTSNEMASSNKDKIIIQKESTAGGAEVVEGDPGQSKEEDRDLYTTRK